MNNGEIKQAEYNIMVALEYAKQSKLTENEKYYVNALKGANDYIKHLVKENNLLEQERASLHEQLEILQENLEWSEND